MIKNQLNMIDAQIKEIEHHRDVIYSKNVISKQCDQLLSELEKIILNCPNNNFGDEELKTITAYIERINNLKGD